jgi:hypothetical protein
MNGVGGTTAGVRPLTRRAAEVMLPAATGACNERDRTRAETAPIRPLSHTALLNYLCAEIKAPLTLRRVRPQTLRRSFWDDRAWVPLKMILLAALVVAAALL